MFYLVKSPWILKKLYPSCTWDITTKEKKLYLTFDDGPHPDVTPYVLELLDQYSAKATFFCIGRNVTAYPQIYARILEANHAVGNHTNSHLNGWKTSDKTYLQDISDACGVIDTNLFRPPYGRISRFQLEQLQHEKFRLKTIMWSVLSGDFDPGLGSEECYLNVTRNSEPGSIIVFHDSIKAYEKLKFVLPKVMEYFSSAGYLFESIPYENNDASN